MYQSFCLYQLHTRKNTGHMGDRKINVSVYAQYPLHRFRISDLQKRVCVLTHAFLDAELGNESRLSICHLQRTLSWTFLPFGVKLFGIWILFLKFFWICPPFLPIHPTYVYISCFFRLPSSSFDCCLYFFCPNWFRSSFHSHFSKTLFTILSPIIL